MHDIIVAHNTSGRIRLRAAEWLRGSEVMNKIKTVIERLGTFIKKVVVEPITGSILVFHANKENILGLLSGALNTLGLLLVLSGVAGAPATTTTWHAFLGILAAQGANWLLDFVGLGWLRRTLLVIATVLQVRRVTTRGKTAIVPALLLMIDLLLEARKSWISAA